MLADNQKPSNAVGGDIDGSTANVDFLRDRVIDTLRACYDPEIPVNIYDLGLIYNIDVTAAGQVSIRMTLTAPSCPVAEALPAEVEARVAAIPDVTEVAVEVVWEPPWNRDRLSGPVKLQLGLL